MIAQPVSHHDDDISEKLRGIPYQHQWVPAGVLEIGATYQRRIDLTWVKKLAAEFDPFLLDDLLVNRTPKGNFIVMDGQHRLLAILEMGWGDQNVPCKVYDNLPEALQAKRFNVQDVRKKLPANAAFNAKLIEGDGTAIAIRDAVERAGFQLNLDNGDLDHGRIAAINALNRLAKMHGVTMIRDTLDLIAAAFGTAFGPHYVALMGVASFLSRYRELADRSRTVQIMRQTTLNALIAEGRDIARALGVRHDVGIVYALWKAYNHRLLEARRLPDPSTTRNARAAK